MPLAFPEHGSSASVVNVSSRTIMMAERCIM